MISNSKDAVNLDQAPRILLDISVDDTPIKILFDPALQYPMIPSSIYYNMQQKPPLAPLNKVEIGIFLGHILNLMVQLT